MSRRTQVFSESNVVDAMLGHDEYADACIFGERLATWNEVMLFPPFQFASLHTSIRTLKEAPALTADKPLEYKFRLAGTLPLLFFLAQGIHYWRSGELGNMLWMCNIGNLLFAIGMFLDNRRLMRTAIIWTIPGLFIWFFYYVLWWGPFFSSTLAHVGGLIVGLFVLRRIGMDRQSWIYAFAWYLIVQLASRLFTATDLNVNLAHKIQPGWDQRFGSYWQFWLVLTVVTACVLWLVERLFRWIWPMRAAQHEITRA